jgi:hypothetical protein
VALLRPPVGAATIARQLATGDKVQTSGAAKLLARSTKSRCYSLQGAGEASATDDHQLLLLRGLNLVARRGEWCCCKR